MDTNKTAIAQLIEKTEVALSQEVRKEMRSLEDNELLLVGGGESIPNW